MTVISQRHSHLVGGEFRPRLPLPPPIRAGEMSTWAYDTMTVRTPVIARRVLEENELSPGARGRMLSLIEEIPGGPIRQIRKPGAPDEAQWRRYVAAYLGWDWLGVPWFFAEHYFFRRVAEAVDYFRTGLDPYARQKAQGLAEGMPAVRQLARLQSARPGGLERADELRRLFLLELWGNRADLSLWPAGAGNSPHTHVAATAQAESDARRRLLVDQRAAAAAHLAAEPAARLDIMLDNAGFEIVTDLLLADFWLSQDPGATVLLHVKGHPIYVSDVVETDVTTTIARLATDEDEPAARLGRRLEAALAGGRLACRTHPFLTSPLAGWEMPLDLRQTLSPARLVVCKGDVNYRRLLGDRHWSHSAPFGEIVSYYPASLLALRTLKAQLAAGLSPG